jgi:hypothetical protein
MGVDGGPTIGKLDRTNMTTNSASPKALREYFASKKG